MSKNTTALHANPFYVLRVTTRDDKPKIVAMAEERSLEIEDGVCQSAKSCLINPRTRLAAEMAWLPGVAPRTIDKMLLSLPAFLRSTQNTWGLPSLAQANLMAAACELSNSNELAPALVGFIHYFAEVVESIDPEDVLRDINEDRTVSQFPEIQGVEAIEAEIVERRKTYQVALTNLLDATEPLTLLEVMTEVVTVATEGGNESRPILIHGLVDSYEKKTLAVLEKGAENVIALVNRIREAAPQGPQAVDPPISQLEAATRRWVKIAAPIQLSNKSQGLEHGPSNRVAYGLRNLSVDLNNDHGMLSQASRINLLLLESFAAIPEVAEKLKEDAEALEGLRNAEQERARKDEEWARSITFRADVGLILKEELAISPEGIRWKGRSYPLDSISRVRWGGVKRSMNGIPTGTDYTIAFGSNRSETSIKLNKESTYSGFIETLWRAVCVRLLFDIGEALGNGQPVSIGDIVVEDAAFTLTRHKFLGTEPVRVGWNQVHVWTANGSFVVGHKDDKKIYSSASYINVWNTHIIEHLIRGSFKKPNCQKLSDYLKS